jgi:hypothetical protein
MGVTGDSIALSIGNQRKDARKIGAWQLAGPSTGELTHGNLFVGQGLMHIWARFQSAPQALF